MKKMLLLGIMAVALVASVPAFAANAGLSLQGPTGVARTPMAAALPPMTLGIAADYITSADTFVPVRLEVGVIEGLELGGMYWFTNAPGDLKFYGANAKYVLPFKMVDGLAVAVGVDYTVASAGADVKTFGVNGVASYTVNAGIPIVPSVGVKWSSVDMPLGSDSGFQFFGSLVAMVMPNLAVGGEIISVNSDIGQGGDASMWFGARFMPMDSLTVQAGVCNNANVGGADGSDWTANIGLQYAFSFGK